MLTTTEYTTVRVEAQEGSAYTIAVEPPITEMENINLNTGAVASPDQIRAHACNVANALSRLRCQEILLDLSVLPGQSDK